MSGHHFIGGPLDGKFIDTGGRWPFQAHEMTGPGHGIGRGGQEGWSGPTYRTLLYYPVHLPDGTQLAITEEHYKRAQRNGGLDEAPLKRFALKRLYEAVTGDHNDPTDESGDELDKALAMAETLINAPVEERDRSEGVDMMGTVRWLEGLNG